MSSSSRSLSDAAADRRWSAREEEEEEEGWKRKRRKWRRRRRRRRKKRKRSHLSSVPQVTLGLGMQTDDGKSYNRRWNNMRKERKREV